MLRNTVNGLYGSRGSTIMISVVVIILFGAFAFVLNKMKVDTSDIFNNTVMYQRADNAAYSVLEIATYQLYPLNAHSADAPSTAIDDTQGGCDRVTKTYSEGNIVYPLGSYVIEEVKESKGYMLNPEKFIGTTSTSCLMSLALTKAHNAF